MMKGVSLFFETYEKALQNVDQKQVRKNYNKI